MCTSVPVHISKRLVHISQRLVLHLNRSVSSAWTLLWCFHFLVCLYQKLLSKTVGDLSWPAMTSVAWWGVTGRNCPIHGVKFTCKLMFESVSNGFRPKVALIMDFNGEVTKLTWPEVADIKILRFTLYSYCYGYQSLKVARRSVSRCISDEHENFLRWGHLALPGDLTLRDLGLKFFQLVRNEVWIDVLKTAVLCAAVSF